MADIRTSHLVEARYVEGAAGKRAPYREEHLERMGKLYRQGHWLSPGRWPT